MPVDEILVHISASTSKKDDDRYRAIALAYDQFEPLKRHDVTGHNFGGDKITTYRSSKRKHAEHDETPQESFCELEPQTSSKAITKPLVPQSEDVRRPLKDTSLRAKDTPCQYIEETPLAVLALESQLLTSSLLEMANDSPLDARRNKKRRVENARDKERIESKAMQDSGVVQEQTSQVHMGHLNLSNPSQSLIATQPTESTESDKIDKATRTAIPATTMAGADEEDRQLERFFTSADETAVESLKRLPQHLSYENVPVASHDPRTYSYLTGYLANGQDDPPEARLFLRWIKRFPNDEAWQRRGHWAFNTAGWTLETQAFFWSSLDQVFKSGWLGWSPQAFRNVGRSYSRDSEIGDVRVYCPAQIIEPIFVLLYRFSRGMIKTLESDCVFKDAGMEVMVKVSQNRRAN
ncbi:MAG: hypothetical protein M1828_005566 [Chrysothrix sp. TS-e1954]|nr:MAG: hypothetical protein M1828_005566 [Chrysothrix sp. TS-e1954]